MAMWDRAKTFGFAAATAKRPVGARLADAPDFGVKRSRNHAENFISGGDGGDGDGGDDDVLNVVLDEVNVVVDFHLGCDLDLQALVEKHPTVFGWAHVGAQVGLTFPATTFMIPANSHITVMKGTTDLTTRFGVYMFEFLLRLHGYTHARAHHVRVNNSTTQFTYGTSLDLKRMKEENSATIRFIEGQFPGACVTLPGTKICVKAFRYGDNFIIAPTCRHDAVGFLKAVTPFIMRYALFRE